MLWDWLQGGDLGAERRRFEITAEGNENKSSPERCFLKSARRC